MTPVYKDRKSLSSEYCSVLSSEYILQLSTHTYKLHKWKEKDNVVVDPSQVAVLGPVDQNMSKDFHIYSSLKPSVRNQDFSLKNTLLT